MPFTLTHILAVVPVAAARPKLFPFAALVIGCMVPDLPLFVPPGRSRDLYLATHSPLGLLTADLPLGLIVYVSFRELLRRPLFALLPTYCQSRCVALLPRRERWTPGYVLRVAAALVVGAATHIAWDSFTHEGRLGTTLIPALNRKVMTLAGYDIPLYKALQYASTIVGLPILALLLLLWFRRQPPRSFVGVLTLPPVARVAVWALAILIPLPAAWLFTRDARVSPYNQLSHAITDSGFVLGIVLLLYALGYLMVERQGRRDRPAA